MEIWSFCYRNCSKQMKDARNTKETNSNRQMVRTVEFSEWRESILLVLFSLIRIRCSLIRAWTKSLYLFTHADYPETGIPGYTWNPTDSYMEVIFVYLYVWRSCYWNAIYKIRAILSLSLRVEKKKRNSSRLEM